MEISNQVCNPQNVCIEDRHLSNIHDNIDIWEKFQTHPQILQKKLTQTTAILQNENLQSFSLNIKVPSTYFAGVEENYTVVFGLDSLSNNQVNDFMNEENSIRLDLNYHRMSSIYDMNQVIQFVFNMLQQKLPKTNTESLEIVTSLIVFEIEMLSKQRKDGVNLTQQMFSIDNPHFKWTSSIDIKARFSDYQSSYVTKYYH